MGTTFLIRYGIEQTSLDVYRVYQTFMKYAKKHPLYKIAADKEHIWTTISLLNKVGQIAYFYLEDVLVGVVAFTIQNNPLWWTKNDCKMLEELFVLQLSDMAGFGRVAAQFLKDMCRDNECTFVTTGALLGSNNSYRKIKGYSIEYPTFLCLRKDCDTNNHDE